MEYSLHTLDTNELWNINLLFGWSLHSWNSSWTQLYEPKHDETNQITSAPAKIQISLGIHPVWSAPLLFPA